MSGSIEDDSRSGQRLDRGRLGLRTWAGARMHVPGRRSRYWVLAVSTAYTTGTKRSNIRSYSATIKTGPSTCHGHCSFHARCCRSARSANYSCGLPSFPFILTASLASLSFFSEDTFGNISDCILAASRLFYSNRLLSSGFCPAPATLCPGMS